jgi:hypothetical protein
MIYNIHRYNYDQNESFFEFSVSNYTVNFKFMTETVNGVTRAIRVLDAEAPRVRKEDSERH